MQIFILAIASILLMDSAPVPTGQASYYAHHFSGRRTASGERYRPEAFTAAHRSYPFGTRLLVTRLDTNDSVIVRVNDRGPFVRGRIIDLSRAAADRLDMVRAGTCRVSVRFYSPPSADPDSMPAKPGVVVTAGDTAPLFPREIFPEDDRPGAPVETVPYPS